MKCPNCQAEIPDDKLYCEKCGAELLIVTDIDLDMDIQHEMENTMSDIVENEFKEEDYSDYELEDDLEYDDDPNFLSFLMSGKAGGKVFYIVLAIVVVAAIAAAAYFAKQINSQNSLEYKLEMAETAVQNNSLLEAIDYLEDAYKLDGDVEHLFDIADYYYTLGRDNDAIYTLTDIATAENAKNADVLEAYSKIVSLYEANANYEALAELIGNSDNAEVKATYSKYLVADPVFSYEGGTYEETLELKISSGLSNGNIYYTIGNQTPTEDSDVLETFIPLEYGNYTVNAIYINEYGVKSNVVTEKYLIDVEFVFEPTILTEEGEYTSATTIEASVPQLYTLYYTTDGRDPDKTCTKYTDPIQMPLGTTTYKFVEYASDGTMSTIVEKTYTLTFNTAINSETAPPYLKNLLYQRGILSDTEGHKLNTSGYYDYELTTAYHFSKGDYFFLVEYHYDDFGNKSKTGVIYAMHVINADDIYLVTSLGNNNYKLTDF